MFLDVCVVPDIWNITNTSHIGHFGLEKEVPGFLQFFWTTKSCQT